MKALLKYSEGIYQLFSNKTYFFRKLVTEEQDGLLLRDRVRILARSTKTFDIFPDKNINYNFQHFEEQKLLILRLQGQKIGCVFYICIISLFTKEFFDIMTLIFEALLPSQYFERRNFSKEKYSRNLLDKSIRISHKIYSSSK